MFGSRSNKNAQVREETPRRKDSIDRLARQAGASPAGAHDSGAYASGYSAGNDRSSERGGTDPRQKGLPGQPGPGHAGSSVTGSQATNPLVIDQETVISRDIRIEGNITAENRVRLEGVVEGDVRGTNIVVGQYGRVTGSVKADSVEVYGRVAGAIHGREVMLYRSAHVEGDILHQGIGIEMGTHYDGRLKWDGPRPDARGADAKGKDASNTAARSDAISAEARSLAGKNADGASHAPYATVGASQAAPVGIVGQGHRKPAGTVDVDTFGKGFSDVESEASTESEVEILAIDAEASSPLR